MIALQAHLQVALALLVVLALDEVGALRAAADRLWVARGELRDWRRRERRWRGCREARS